MKRFYSVLEIVPSILLLIMAFLTTLSAITRYAFSWPIPDEYEISRLLLSVVICWGMALAFRHHDHIQLDIYWGALSARGKRVLTRIGSGISMILVAGVALALASKTVDTHAAGLLTVDLNLPVWGFYAAAWAGILAAFFILLGQFLMPEKMLSSDETDTSN
ncbi:TRAP transporter small permease [Alcaligenes endophyticus]|uniref:TRAP transporter small permease protein n=1 Tax=Alcaligenes endophyticus TaxID=1929088 RepID=A0ABT8EGA0_9BURK|nr:TRAP transporter small permease [Alcaligenes endophyticus]MCX5590167.1 TRAP transporter small permease [Alcaligenes endophyticus]MDN4120170.1 TRAP transporter small permease [Alcaligenes endophyticus]